MLVTLCDYPQSVTLIANSGVQFLDFGLTPRDDAALGRFVRKTANGPLLRLDYDIASARYTLPAGEGHQPEVVKPESTLSLAHSLAVLDGAWLPLPVMRFNPPRAFIEGPDNWARVQIRRLPEPDDAGNSHRITLRQPDKPRRRRGARADRKRPAQRHALRAGVAGRRRGGLSRPDLGRRLAAGGLYSPRRGR